MYLRFRIYPVDIVRAHLEVRPPGVGHYLLAAKAAYLVLGVKCVGKRGGLGNPVCWIYRLEVERVPRAEAEARVEDGIVTPIEREPRRRRRRSLRLNELAERAHA
jgi:hypothetical protein